MPASKLRRLLMCPLGLCGMATQGNDTHLWGECPRCGKRAGVVSRASVRAYIEAKERAKEAAARVDADRDAVLNAARRR